jgi:hypothetical protein
MMKIFGDKLRFTRATDALKVIDDTGRLRPAVIPSTRSSAPGPRPGCGYAVKGRPTTIPFDGPVIGGGWWTRIGYIASGDGALRVTLGKTVFEEPIHRGLHNLFVQADGPFRAITLQVLTPGVGLCTDDIKLGLPVALEPAGSS